MTGSTFKIIEHKGNKPGTLPSHWDICLVGQSDSIMTIWDSRELAESIVSALQEWAMRRKEEPAGMPRS